MSDPTVCTVADEDGIRLVIDSGDGDIIVLELEAEQARNIAHALLEQADFAESPRLQ